MTVTPLRNTFHCTMNHNTVIDYSRRAPEFAFMCDL
ncbi:hypothetical protein D623_10029250 [Myotis brandtii]|uniref:Uncharacterized protein n=1 Tax=Myotis brandtii TaxID=109478 RepID=S7N6G9_MYOBR|nr:hypothetical protein D623_10029250 [Myotis brandtii]